MNIDFHSKYIKYKTKYLSLKNTNIITEDQNNILIGGADKKFTYLILDNQGLYHDRLREILDAKGFKEVSKQHVLSSPNKFVDFFWMGQSNEEGNRFDKELYKIKSTLKTLLWRDNSHIRGKDAITNKQQLYLNMKKFFPEICSKHMAKTFILDNIESLKQIKLNDTDELTTTTTDESITSTDTDTDTDTEKNSKRIFIVKPVGHGACAGVGVTVITNDKELLDARKELCKRFKHIIISEYIQNPLLYEGRKCHMRMFLLINSDSTWSLWEKGRIKTANLKYKKSDWTNKDIHDTHLKSTPKDIYYPEDLFSDLPHGSTNLKEKYEYVHQQMKIILDAVAKIVKPHVKCYEESKNCCEVFGVDFMITDDYVVKLIEINAEASYEMKDKDDKKFKKFCSEYFDWFYKESLLSKLKYLYKKKLTYLISGYSELNYNILKKILNTNGFTEVDKKQIFSTHNNYVDLLIATKVDSDYDKDIYKFQSTLITILSKDNKNRYQNIRVILNKDLLYFNMKKYFPDICSKHMAKTFYLKDIQSLKQFNIDDTTLSTDVITLKNDYEIPYIIRPVEIGLKKGVGVVVAYKGYGIEVITNDKELEEVRKELSKIFNEIIISEYIINPLLYEGLKFHIRMYILINSNSTWSFWKRGKVMTAKLPYIKSDWTNKDIHDTHFKSTFKDIYFPEDILPKEKYEYVYKQIENILNSVYKIAKPHVKCYDGTKYCCGIYGIDFMITDDYIVKLIEINVTPGYYEDKDENNIKFFEYQKDYFDWFYKESISKIFNKTITTK